jgi:Uma2 family endonuclease
MTFEEFLTSPYERAEWVDGEVFELSPENRDHVGVAGFLHHVIEEFVEQRGLGQVLQGFLMKTGPNLAGRVPDLIFVAKEHEDRLRRTHVDGPADLVVEVVSPDSVKRDREVKRREYEEGGVPEFWLIDPLDKRATFLSLEDGVYRALAIDSDGAVRSRVLPGVWIRPEWLLGDRRPRLAEVRRAWGLE